MENLKALQDFMLDIDCLDELLPWTERFNIFDVLKVSRTEIRHSNMLGWLLDPNENHGLEDLFLKGIFNRLAENDSDGRYDMFNMSLLDVNSFCVYREWKNIDILLVSEKENIIIAIENKISSHEHSNQLNRYREILENDYVNYRRMYLFLTPDGEEPSDVENWDILTYKDIVEVLEILYGTVKLQADVELVIRNYIEILRRDIVEDMQLIELCNKIYNKHKKALDLIFENRIDERTQISQSIMNALLELSKDGEIIYNGDWGNYSFRTKEMDKLLPILDEPNSSWGTQNCYSYWLNIRDGRFYAVFELGGWNVPDNVMKTMDKIIDELKPNDKKKEAFRYKRVFKSQWYDLNDADDMEAEAKKAVKDSLEEIRKMEAQICLKLSK